MLRIGPHRTIVARSRKFLRSQEEARYSNPSSNPPPSKQDGLPISDSHVKLCGQQIAIKAPPAPQTQVSLGIYEENEFAAPIPDGVPQFHHKILRPTLQKDKEFKSISMDPLLAKEYEDWRAHVRYIEHLYEIRLRGGR